jgi:hypothetical protein
MGRPSQLQPCRRVVSISHDTIYEALHAWTRTQGFCSHDVPHMAVLGLPCAFLVARARRVAELTSCFHAHRQRTVGASRCSRRAGQHQHQQWRRWPSWRTSPSEPAFHQRGPRSDALVAMRMKQARRANRISAGARALARCVRVSV